MERSEAARGDGAWFACYTRARAEKKVHAQLAERGIESYLPVVPRVGRWSDRSRVVVLPLFTSYVFAREEVLGRVVDVPGVHDVVRFDGRPALIPDSEIRNIERFVAALAASHCEPPPVPFPAGQRVLITAGPFQGVEGVVLKARRRRVVVGLAAIGAGFAVNVDATALAPVPSA